MKPLGRLRNLKGLSWKRDFRIRQNGKKIGNGVNSEYAFNFFGFESYIFAVAIALF